MSINEMNWIDKWLNHLKNECMKWEGKCMYPTNWLIDIYESKKRDGNIINDKTHTHAQIEDQIKCLS